MSPPGIQASSLVGPDLARLAEAIAERGLRLGGRLHLQDETESTNDDAKRGAKDGEPHGALWVAESQRKGRGRQGRTWLSPRGENLLFSVLLRIPCSPVRVPPVSLACGLAVRDAVARAVGDDADVLVKWPNDVLVKRRSDGRMRKIAGILVESGLVGSRVDYVVVGIGINVHTKALPEEVAELATSVAIERGDRGLEGPPDRASILADVLAGLEHDVEHVAHRGLGLVHGRLSRSDALLGREVESDAGELRGTANGIDPEGRLVVRKDDGTIVRVISGEVRLKPLAR
ncbi:Biotin operon repressor / Biotin-protein ligase [Labilithrix luteola]|uniref:biotin--[biotin carboxyl-carrier protein] ligase n=1 Tax=Labilithrix luteola TaxID=1391654 RepID=A0A0K1Q1N0_9BACT|nr:biotin--[acetyl-CoA-carboxylase] ligase [Labilithrix luteola]AKU99688.1 Biotin operon repressor / Biotin-protein ligase [Labilithrix luteola]